MRDSNANFLSRAIRVSFLIFAFLALALIWGINVNAQNQKLKAKIVNTNASAQSLYNEYRGVHLGMTTEEARAKLGEPALKGDDQDYYLFTAYESAQIAYNSAHKVVTISIDYVGGNGAPDYRTVVGADVQAKPDGSIYKLVRYEREGYWVSYNKTAAASPVITITLQQQ